MTKIFVLSLFVILTNTSIGQNPRESLNFIEVEGYSKLAVVPDLYNVIITIQEPEQRIGYTIIGKTPIDSIKFFMAEALKKYGISLKDLKIIGITSRDTYTGQLPFSLTSIVYSCKLKNKEEAQKMVNELKFNGLKGIVVNWSTSEEKTVAFKDSVYHLALIDAREAATKLAATFKKTIGEIRTITVVTSDMNRLDKDLTYDMYNNFRFEYDNRDLFIKAGLRVSFELK
jgi:hypothetical protein